MSQRLQRLVLIATVLLSLAFRLGAENSPELWSEEEREAIELSFIALAGCEFPDPARVAAAVTNLVTEALPQEEIIWGPAVHMPSKKNGGFLPPLSDALVLITRDRGSGLCSVIFRGTNTISADEWILQDFMVERQSPWRDIVALPALPEGLADLDLIVPADALISEGTAAAMTIRLALVPAPGLPGEGRSFAQALLELATGTEGPPRLRFTGHSLGGLLAPVAALWLLDRLEVEGRGDLAASLAPEILAFAGPTPGNAAFARRIESRLPGLRRYVNDLDIAPRAWEDEALAELPSLYLPAISMQPITRSLYGLCSSIARGKGYAQPGPAIDIPSHVVPARAGLYLLEAAWQHMMPYLEMLEPEREGRIIREVMEPVAASVTVPGLKPVDLMSLYSTKE